MVNTRRRNIKRFGQTMSSSPVSVLIVALELDRVNGSACGCNPNLSSTVHPTGDCRTTSARSFRSPASGDHSVSTLRDAAGGSRRLQSAVRHRFKRIGIHGPPFGLLPPVLSINCFWASGLRLAGWDSCRISSKPRAVRASPPPDSATPRAYCHVSWNFLSSPG